MKNKSIQEFTYFLMVLGLIVAAIGFITWISFNAGEKYGIAVCQKLNESSK